MVVPVGRWVLWVLWVLWYYEGYYGSTHGYYGTIGYYRVLRVVRYYKRVLCSTHGYYIVPKTGYYRVLQAYAAEGMSRVRVGLKLRVCTHSAWYLTFLWVI